MKHCDKHKLPFNVQVLRTCVATALLPALLSGCGTLSNVTGRERLFLSELNQRQPRLYGGVRNDIEWLNLDDVPAHRVPKHLSRAPFSSTLYIADIPASLVADTLTIPLVLKHHSATSLGPQPEPPPDRPASKLELGLPSGE